MEDTPVQHEESSSKGAFFLEEGGQRVAEMTYSRAGDAMWIIDHTDVTDELRGTGAGRRLVLAAVEQARLQGIKLLPLCPFAKSVFDKEPEIRDVL